MARAERTSACRLESQSPEPLAANDFTILVPVGGKPRHEEAVAHGGLLLVGDGLVDVLGGEYVTHSRIAFHLEFRVGRDDPSVARVVEELQWVVLDHDGDAAAVGDALQLGWGHRP